MSVLQSLADRQRRRAQVLELLDQISADDPAFLPELAEALASVTPDGGRVRAERHAPRQGGRVSTLIQIQDWFREKENAWATVDEVVEGIGAKKNTVAHVVYKTGKKHFESRDPGSGRAKQYRLSSYGGMFHEPD